MRLVRDRGKGARKVDVPASSPHYLQFMSVFLSTMNERRNVGQLDHQVVKPNSGGEQKIGSQCQYFNVVFAHFQKRDFELQGMLQGRSCLRNPSSNGGCGGEDLK